MSDPTHPQHQAPSPGDEVTYGGRSWVVMEVIGRHVGLASDERQELAWAKAEEIIRG